VSRNTITFASTNGTIKVVEDDFDLTVTFGDMKVEYAADTEEVTVYRRDDSGTWQARVGTGPARRPKDPHRTFHLPDGTEGKFASAEELRRPGLR
jgi:hypothetical protein